LHARLLRVGAGRLLLVLRVRIPLRRVTVASLELLRLLGRRIFASTSREKN
jgi:hypothetical protein